MQSCALQIEGWFLNHQQFDIQLQSRDSTWNTMLSPTQVVIHILTQALGLSVSKTYFLVCFSWCHYIPLFASSINVVHLLQLGILCQSQTIFNHCSSSGWNAQWSDMSGLEKHYFCQEPAILVGGASSSTALFNTQFHWSKCFSIKLSWQSNAMHRLTHQALWDTSRNLINLLQSNRVFLKWEWQ